MEVEWRDSERELERIFERNMATHVSKQPKTSALCKNNLSNYEERPLLSGMLYCRRTSRQIPPLPPHTYISCIYLDAVIYCL